MRDEEKVMTKDDAPEDRCSGISRRDAMKLTAGAAIAARAGSLAAMAQAKAAAAPAVTAPRFFTAPELSLLDELTEMILPADEHSPGARAAKVAAYVDERMAERDPGIPDYANERRLFKEGLAAVDKLSVEMNGRPFLEAAPEKRLEVLTRLAAFEGDEDAPGAPFFHSLKRWTVHAYYTSEIGLQKEIEYKGNRRLREFVGAEQLDGK
jgi:hypothetical protein